MAWLLGGILLSGGISARTLADSSAVLFDDGSVRTYALSFYDTAWQTRMEANWKADTGWVPARFSDGTLVLDSVGVRYKGNSSYTLAGNSPKKPFKIKFSEFKAQTYYGVKVLNFSNVIGDPSFLREKISYDIASRFLPTPRAAFAVLKVDSVRIGLYTQVEDPDKAMLKRWYASAGGNLFKAGDDGASLAWKGSVASVYGDSGWYDLKTNTSANNWNGFVGFLDFLNNSTDSVFCADFPGFLDADNATKALAFNMVFSNFDSYTGSGRNYYLYQTSDAGAMDLLPWDLNLSFGGYSNGWDVLSQDLLTVSNLADRPLNRRVLGCEPLKLRYLGWVRSMIQGPASTDSIKAHVARLAPVIRAHVEADSNKFYSTANFETNLTSNVRTGSGVILGLEAFSTGRNAKLQAQLATYLPAQYVGLKDAATPIPAVGVYRLARGFELHAAEVVDLELVMGSGRLLRRLSLSAGERATLRGLPRGLIFLRVRTSSSIQTHILHTL